MGFFKGESIIAGKIDRVENCKISHRIGPSESGIEMQLHFGIKRNISVAISHFLFEKMVKELGLDNQATLEKEKKKLKRQIENYIEDVRKIEKRELKRLGGISKSTDDKALKAYSKSSNERKELIKKLRAGLDNIDRKVKENPLNVLMGRRLRLLLI